MNPIRTEESKWIQKQSDAEEAHRNAEHFASRAILHLLQASLLAAWGVPVLAARVLFEVPIYERRQYLDLLPDFLAGLTGTAAEAPLAAAQIALRQCARQHHNGVQAYLEKAARLREVGTACVVVAGTAHDATTRAVIWRCDEAARLYHVVRSGKTFVEVRLLDVPRDTPVLRINQRRGDWPEGTSVCRLGKAPEVREVRA